MGRKKSNKKWTLKIIYIVCAVIVLVAGIYYENGYKDISTFINDISNNIFKVSTTIIDNVTNTLSNDNSLNKETSVVAKKVNGKLQMHLMDVGQRR